MVKTYLNLPKNVYLLFLSQIIGMSATSLIALTGGIIGAQLAPSPFLATLPQSSLVTGLALATIPSAILMKKIGRKQGFMLSSVIALCGCLLAAFALYQQNFFLFCLAIIIVGTNGAFVQQYRFAAVESVSSDVASKAASFVLFAGVFAGILGPEIAKHTKGILTTAEYAGSFLILALLYGCVIFLLSRITDTTIHKEKIAHTHRSIVSILTTPGFFLAALAGSLGFGVMSFIMTATPVHLHTLSHYSLDETAFVIQSHIIAMFVPSLITGVLLERLGILKVLMLGLGSFSLTILIGTHAESIPMYMLGLVLLGIGWNFLFMSSTMLIAKNFTSTEKFKAQGLHDFIVILTQLTGTFLAGRLLYGIGWVQIHLLIIPLLLFAFITYVLFHKRLVTE